VIEQIIDLGYQRRSIFAGFHDRIRGPSPKRWACMICHRRAGKTVASLMDLLEAALSEPGGRYCYIAPLRNQAKTVAWDYLTAFARPVQAKPPNQAELYVELINGSRITLFGADNPDALRGPFFNGAVLDEYADIAPALFNQIVRPALSDRHGFAVVMGTLKGRNQLWELYTKVQHDPIWYTALLKASETEAALTHLDPEWPSELADMRRQMSDDEYAAELECDPFAAIKGAYYGKEMMAAQEEGRIRSNVPRLPGPVHTAWDFGNGLNMAVWAFQVGERGPLVHDFIQLSGCYFEDYLKEVIKRGYDGFDYVPHDARVPSFETGRTRIETMMVPQFKRKPVLVADHHVEDGINAVKLMLPRTVFNADTCGAGVEALRQYVQEWSDKTRTFSDTPKKNWAAHAADALRYLAMAWREMKHEVPPPKPPLFIPTEELTIGDWIKFSKRSEKRERA
jgi:phage terminase large subunit